ncbi:MAG: hypothetical protein QN204_04925 [Armatimonadota bacterium]|nr:hypothetical protein [Armatimonadota bacterium]
MNDLLTLLAQAYDALAQGAPPDQVDARIREYTRGEYSGLSDLHRGARVTPTQALYEHSLTALRSGEDPEVVDARIQAVSQHFGRRLPNVFALRMAAESEGHAEEARRAQDVADNPLKYVAASAVQGFFPWTDELLRAPALAELAKTHREVSPLSAELASLAGAAVPVGGALSLLRGGSRAAARAATPAAKHLRPIATRAALGATRGAVTGGALGGVMAAGAADPGARAQSAVPGAVFGALGGGVTGGLLGMAAGGLLYRRGLGERLRRAMTEGTQIPAGQPPHPMLSARSHLVALRDHIKRNVYQVLDQQYPKVADLDVSDVLLAAADNPRLAGSVTDGLPQNVRNTVAEALRRRNTGAKSWAIPELSFSQIQAVRQNLRRAAYTRTGRVADPDAKDLYERLTQIMDYRFNVRAANEAWEKTYRMEEALNMGLKSADLSYESLVARTQGMSQEALDYFNRGRLSEWRARLSRDPSAQRRLLRLADDPDRRASLATMFPGGEQGEAFQEFLRLLRAERRNTDLVALIDRILVSGAVAGVAGGMAAMALGR